MEMYEEAAELFRALGDPMRLTILALLRVREACVCELVGRLPISQPAVSQHLRRLKQAGLVVERRHKQWTFYRLNPELSEPVRTLIAQLPRNAEDERWLLTHRVETSCAVEPAPVPVDIGPGLGRAHG
jgi:ArsR family transcriptional regulator